MVFAMCGAVFGYATHSLDGRGLGEVAVVGPLTPGVGRPRLWELAHTMNKEGADRSEQARWIMAQASRALVCGSGVIARYEQTPWELTRGHRARFEAPYCNRDELWTGNLTVPELVPDGIVPGPARPDLG
ncbi:hypothetical protein [Streptomyces sp. NPDC089919]|uniref:hypothetical protein n=1 Tax=Streptomyces sp. NPDC089919 TaxID=3155188 RepID=UPI00341BED6C